MKEKTGEGKALKLWKKKLRSSERKNKLKGRKRSLSVQE